VTPPVEASIAVGYVIRMTSVHQIRGQPINRVVRARPAERVDAIMARRH